MAVAASPRGIRSSARAVWLAAVVGALVAGGCEDGKAPYRVSPGVQIPPGGIQPGTTRSVGQIYHFDPLQYRMFKPPGQTDPPYIKRDSELGVATRGNPAA